ncbi:MAG: hypothetical protein KJO26_03855 [Deltaproteobacteria bacterium]|nr:hypothetical protein [Deltaproteobacteria bacterium]
MDDKKDNRNVGLNFPRGNVEEMLRMMRKCREEGNIDCEIIMKEFMGKRVRSVDYKQIKKKLFGEDSN